MKRRVIILYICGAIIGIIGGNAIAYHLVVSKQIDTIEANNELIEEYIENSLWKCTGYEVNGYSDLGDDIVKYLEMKHSFMVEFNNNMTKLSSCELK